MIDIPGCFSALLLLLLFWEVGGRVGRYFWVDIARQFARLAGWLAIIPWEVMNA